MPPTEVSFDLGATVERMRVSIRRASVFIGISSNIRAADPPISHVLDASHRVRVQLVQQDVTTETLSHFHEEFEYWVIGNGLRDIADAFSFYVSSLYVWYVFITDQSARSNIDRINKIFSKKGLRDQIVELCQTADIPNEYTEIFESWRRARNCLSHRNGVVGPEDCEINEQNIKIVWNFLNIYADYGGEFHAAIDLESSEGFRVERDTVISAVYERKSKIFPLGGQLRLSRRDLLEICLCALFLCERLCEHYMVALEGRGVGVRRPDAGAEEGV